MTELQSQAMNRFYEFLQKANWQDFCEQIEQQPEQKIQSSIKVNFEPEERKNLDPQTKKKLKRKEYKLRKRQKERINEKQAKIQLATIIQQIYCQTTTFQQKQQRIEICLSYLDRGDKFHNFLTQVIRIHVNSVQRQICQHTKELLKLYPVSNQQENTFYVKYAQCILLGYQHICKATSEIKKIIRFYMILTENRDYLGPKHRNYRFLEGDTFAFMIQSDQALQALVRQCQKRIIQNQISCTSQQQQLKKLVKLCQQLDVDLTSESEVQQYEESTATSFEEDENHSSFINSQQDTQHNLGSQKKRKNKKRKLKDGDIQPELQDVLDRLQHLQIDFEQRVECCVQQQWLQKVQSQVKPQKSPPLDNH